jgi:DNA-binding PadR family transcriptional regulator
MRPPFTGRGRDDREETRDERHDLPSREELLAALEDNERRLERGSPDPRLAGAADRQRPDETDERRRPADTTDRQRPDDETERRRPAGDDERRRSPDRADADRRTTRAGNRARRGAVRAAALALLAERPMHGYEIMQELAERTNGAWRPSPGAVYPALSLLHDEGLIVGEGRSGRRAFTLTDAGRAEADKLAAAGAAPWAELVEDQDTATARLQESYEQLGAAVAQLARVGTPGHKATAATRLGELRREIYLMLAGESI